MKTTWDFVEEYYEGYHSSTEIAYNSDLQKIVNGDSDAEKLYNELSEELNTDTVSAIESYAAKLLKESNESVYEKAIQGFIKQRQKL